MARAKFEVVYRSEGGGVVVLGKLGFHALAAEGEQISFSHSKTVAMRDLWAHEKGSDNHVA